MSFKLSARSRARLIGVHPDLVQVVERAIVITETDFSVVEGLRNIATQRRYFELGKSMTMRSRHLPHGPDQVGHAVDLAPWVDGTISWEPEHFRPVAVAMKAAAHALSIPVEWGGDWKKFVDMPHFQLSWERYP